MRGAGRPRLERLLLESLFSEVRSEGDAAKSAEAAAGGGEAVTVRLAH